MIFFKFRTKKGRKKCVNCLFALPYPPSLDCNRGADPGRESLRSGPYCGAALHGKYNGPRVGTSRGSPRTERRATPRCVVTNETRKSPKFSGIFSYDPQIWRSPNLFALTHTHARLLQEFQPVCRTQSPGSEPTRSEKVKKLHHTHRASLPMTKRTRFSAMTCRIMRMKKPTPRNTATSNGPLQPGAHAPHFSTK